MAVKIDGSSLQTTGLINSLTAITTTSGTVADFTGIPAGVKRITVLLNGVSFSGTSRGLIQIGSGGFTTSGYSSSTSDSSATSTAGFILAGATATDNRYGSFRIENVTGYAWICTGMLTSAPTYVFYTIGNVTLGGALDRVRLTTVNGTDTFDAGSVNIFYE